MFQSQLIPVNLTDNEKKRKNENTHKEIACTYQGIEWLLQEVCPQLAQTYLEKIWYVNRLYYCEKIYPCI